jgi:hypothetical protein
MPNDKRTAWMMALAVPAASCGLALGGLQDEIDALHPARGGEIRFTSGTFTEPIVIRDRAYVRIVGTGRGTSGMNFKLREPGPAILIAGSTGCEIDNVTIHGTENVECGVLMTRSVHNGRGGQQRLSRMNIQGDFWFAGVCTVANELLEIRDVRINPRLPNTFGWWTGSEIPEYKPLRGPKRRLQAPVPIAGGTNSVLLVDGRSYVHSSAVGVTSVYLGDGTVNAEIRHLYISNDQGWTPETPPTGESCITLGRVRNVILTGIKCESPNARYGVHVAGIAKNLDMVGCMIQGRVALFVGPDGGLWNSRISGTNAFTSFGDRFKPARIEGQLQGSVLDIGAYAD